MLTQRRTPQGERVPTDGFDTIFTQERLPMVRLAFLMLRSEALAEEIVQDAFVTVLERWHRLDNPGAYLRRCVVNGCLNQMRRARRSAPPSVDPAEAELADILRIPVGTVKSGIHRALGDLKEALHDGVV